MLEIIEILIAIILAVGPDCDEANTNAS